MIRVLQAVNIMDRAGLETMLMNYYRKIDKEQVQFDFLTHRPGKGAYDDEILSMGGRVFHAPRLYPQNYKNYDWYMKNFFEEHPEYQIIHAHIDAMSAFPLYEAKKNRIPIRISHSHTSRLDIDAKLPIKYLAKLAVPKVANVYCACGEKAGKFLYREKKFELIHNAIDLEAFRFDIRKRKIKRAELGIKDELVIGHVGRYCYIKNQMFLLDIFGEVLKQRADAKLLLIGKGEDEAALRKKVSELSLDEKVLFLLDRSDVKELYQAMDVFVMPSIFEGLPVVGIEAQANGLPCVISNTISDEILLTDTVSMLSIKQPARDWAMKILSVSQERSMTSITQLRDRGYDSETEAEKLAKWYEELTKGLS